MSMNADQDKKFYTEKRFIILMLFFLTPIGLYLMFKYTNWSKTIKIILTPIFLLYFLVYIGVIGSTIENSKTNTTTQQTSTTQTETTPPTKREGTIGTSDKVIPEKLSIRKVRNDVTDNWRLSIITDSSMSDIENYALDYYKKYFKDNKEIHAIINFSLNTTNKIQVSENSIYVTIHEYVDKEEHDAKVLFSGDVLGEYKVYTDNGDIEKIR